MQPINRRHLLRGAARALTLAAFPGLAPSAPPGPDRERPRAESHPERGGRGTPVCCQAQAAAYAWLDRWLKPNDRVNP
jgi:hypothetical protein